MRVKAYVVLTEGTESPSVQELQEFVKAAIAPYKYPREIEFVDELPRTATGKLQRFRLRSMREVAPRRLILSLYGLYARPEGNWLSVAALVALMEDLGVDSAAVRSSVSRLKKRGVLEALKRDGASRLRALRRRARAAAGGRRPDLVASARDGLRTAGWWWCSRCRRPSARSATCSGRC